jgi:lipoprotein-releasing system permease protein
MTSPPHGAADASRPPLARSLVWVIAWRFLRGRRSRLLNGTARSALVATALGVTAMVIAMALMTGYRQGLERQLIGGNSPLLAQPLLRGTPPLTQDVLAELEALPGVLQVGHVAYAPVGAALLTHEGSDQDLDVTLRGVDPGGGQLGARADQLEPGPDGVPGAVLGSELAERLGASLGDRLRLVVLGVENDRPRFRYQSLEVRGVFETGFAEFDSEWVVIDRELLERLLGEAAYPLYEFTLEDPDRAPEVAQRVEEVLGADYLVTDWRQLNRELFAALRLQQFVLFWVLGLIVVVSTFNVASTVVVLVRERMRDIGVLGALGLAPGRLRATFVLYGAILGVVGTILGVAVGAGAAWVLDTFELIRFNPEVAAIYFIRAVPFHLRPLDLTAVVLFSLAVNLLACWFPSRRAATLDPSQALRYE